MSEISRILQNHPAFSRVILSKKPYRKLDFSEQNSDLLNRDLSETGVFSTYIFNELLSQNTYAGIGGYGENRVIYRHRKHFVSEEKSPRSIHLGTDIWTDAGEVIFAPLTGKVHSFAFNNAYGDYGPTIILQHELDQTSFFTLYGHLSPDSLTGMYVGKIIDEAAPFASIGKFPENGDWPPHLHFQVISEMGNYAGDFPGVCSMQDQEYYLKLCPDPNLILREDANI